MRKVQICLTCYMKTLIVLCNVKELVPYISITNMDKSQYNSSTVTYVLPCLLYPPQYSIQDGIKGVIDVDISYK